MRQDENARERDRYENKIRARNQRKRMMEAAGYKRDEPGMGGESIADIEQDVLEHAGKLRRMGVRRGVNQ